MPIRRMSAEVVTVPLAYRVIGVCLDFLVDHAVLCQVTRRVCYASWPFEGPENTREPPET